MCGITFLWVWKCVCVLCSGGVVAVSRCGVCRCDLNWGRLHYKDSLVALIGVSEQVMRRGGEFELNN